MARETDTCSKDATKLAVKRSYEISGPKESVVEPIKLMFNQQDITLPAFAPLLEGPQLGVLLFGSAARGDATAQSDIDVLQLSTRIGSLERGRFSVTVYQPHHLQRMAQNGSLFVLHLVREGRILADPHGYIANILSAYTPPTSYSPLRETLRTTLDVLDASPAELDKNIRGFIRLALFLARTEAYIRCAEAGTPIFAMRSVARFLEDPELYDVFSTRSEHPTDKDFFFRVRHLVERYVGARASRSQSLELFAMNNQKNCTFAAHVANRVASDNTALPYAEILLEEPLL